MVLEIYLLALWCQQLGVYLLSWQNEYELSTPGRPGIIKSMILSLQMAIGSSMVLCVHRDFLTTTSWPILPAFAGQRMKYAFRHIICCNVCNVVQVLAASPKVLTIQ
jgi:hypothetical protein